jgi:hypothetical protein
MVEIAKPQHDGAMPQLLRRRTAGPGVLALLLVLLLWGTPPVSAALVDPTPEPLAADSLPSGPAPELPYLAGLTIHDGHHRVHVPLTPHRSHYVALLGPTRGGYVLLDAGERLVTVYVLRHGHLREVRTVKDHASAFLLGTDGRHVIEIRPLDEPNIHVSVYDLHHRHVQQTKVEGFQGVVGFDGHTAYLVGDASWAWVPGHPKTQIWPSAVASVDVQRNLLWVSVEAPSGGQYFGPTSLDAPSTPPWNANFSPVAVSPDGQYVSGFSRGADGLQIRLVSDGSLVRELAAPFHYYQPLGLWESDGSVLATVSAGRSDIVVRCPVAGACQKAVPKTRDLSVAFQLVVP